MSDDRVLQDARRFSQQFAGFIQAAEQWKDIVSFKQAADEARARVDVLREEIVVLTEQRDTLKAELKAEVEKEMADAKKIAEEYAHHLIKKVNALQSFGRGE
jgi:uncharacterized coiled-coil DUF342 family protein